MKRGNLVRSGGGAPLVVINQVRPILRPLRDSVVAAAARAAVWREGRIAGRGGAGRRCAADSVDRFARGGRGRSDPTRRVRMARRVAGRRMAVPLVGAPGGRRAVGPAPGAAAPARLAAGCSRAALQRRARDGEAVVHRQRGRHGDGTVQLKATFDNANGRLWAGQFADDVAASLRRGQRARRAARRRSSPASAARTCTSSIRRTRRGSAR